MSASIAKEKPQKPEYNTLQNILYVLRSAWSNNKKVVYVMMAQSIITPVIPAVAMFLPMTVVAMIINGANIGRLAAAVLAFTAAIMILQTIKSYYDNTSRPLRTGLRLLIGLDILEKAITTDYANLENKKYTDAKQKAHNVTFSNDQSTEQIYFTLENFGSNIFGFVIYIILLVNINPLILLLTAATSVLGFIVRRRANKWRFDHDDENAGYNKRTQYISFLGEDVAMAKDIRLFSMVGWLNDVYDTYLQFQYSWQRRVQTRQYMADIADCAATFLREGAAYTYLIWLILFNGLPVDQFVLLFAAIGGFSGWIMGILNEYSTLQRHSLDYCRLREYLEYPEVFKRDEGKPIEPVTGKAYGLELRNVSFRYPGAETDIFNNIDLTITPGEKLAIVGLNGAGKTTLVKLLCGFYDPTEGEVLLDGQDIRVFNRKQYYDLFTAVFQEFNILPVTIAENIAQVPEEEIDPDRISHCLDLADIFEKIRSLPDGTDSLMIQTVHDEAVELSGGEMQKLVLARALYKDSPILILDEPTAALDPIAESRLYERYNELSAGKTSVFISHRLASTSFCDRIILIDGKMIVESGTHDELLANGGKYAELFEIQSKYYREGVEF